MPHFIWVYNGCLGENNRFGTEKYHNWETFESSLIISISMSKSMRTERVNSVEALQHGYNLITIDDRSHCGVVDISLTSYTRGCGFDPWLHQSVG